MADKNFQIVVNENDKQKFLSIISMISITFLITAMIFTYRVIEIGAFLTPGGVIPFAITYLIAGIITETYGYSSAKKIIAGNFICIFIFNITAVILLKLPIPMDFDSTAYSSIFDGSLHIMIIYSLGFFFGDRVNAYCISKWHFLLKGKYFIVRLASASLIGQVVFSTIVIPFLYIGILPSEKLFQQFITTILAKWIVILLLSYPCLLIVRLLKYVEKINMDQPRVIFNPFQVS